MIKSHPVVLARSHRGGGEGYSWRESQAEQLARGEMSPSFLWSLHWKPIWTPHFRDSVGQYSSRIFVGRVWTLAVWGSPVFLGSCSQVFTTSQTGKGWTKCPAPNWHPLPELVSCSAHQPYTALDFFSPKLFTYPFWFNNIFYLFSVFNFFF